MRYFFSVRNGDFHDDQEGIILSGDDCARRMATEYAGELIRDNPDIAWENGQLVVRVTDEEGVMLFVVRIETAIGTA